MDIGSVLMGTAIVLVLGAVVKVLFFPKKNPPYTGGGSGGSGTGGGGSWDGGGSGNGGNGDRPEPE